MAAMGLMLTLDPVIMGVMKLPSKNCTTRNTPTTAAALAGEPVSTSVIRAGMVAPTRMPMKGMTASTDAKMAKKMANLTPSSSSPMALSTATMTMTVRSPEM